MVFFIKYNPFPSMFVHLIWIPLWSTWLLGKLTIESWAFFVTTFLPSVFTFLLYVVIFRGLSFHNKELIRMMRYGFIHKPCGQGWGPKCPFSIILSTRFIPYGFPYLKTIFLKVDLEISNNPKIRGFLPIFFVNKTDQILSQFQFSKGITIFLILFA